MTSSDASGTDRSPAIQTADMRAAMRTQDIPIPAVAHHDCLLRAHGECVESQPEHFNGWFAHSHFPRDNDRIKVLGEAGLLDLESLYVSRPVRQESETEMLLRLLHGLCGPILERMSGPLRARRLRPWPRPHRDRSLPRQPRLQPTRPAGDRSGPTSPAPADAGDNPSNRDHRPSHEAIPSSTAVS